MMSKQDDRIELLISRKLDGELSEDQALELDRALIRSPRHRQMLESSEAIDALSGPALRDVLASGSYTVTTGPDAPLRTRSFVNTRRVWWLLPTAIAACLAWVMFPPALSPSASDPTPDLVVARPPAGNGDTMLADAQRGRPMQRNNGGEMQPISTRGALIDRRLDTRHYGVIGDDGRLYLIEVERLRTLRRAAAGSKLRLVSGEL